MASRLTPTLFDKLVSNRAVDEATDPAADDGPSTGPDGVFIVKRLERFNERDMRDALMRDLGWLMNTVNMGSLTDLTDFPEVQKSVLNFGVPDLAGRSSQQRLVQTRGREMRDAIRMFEPRLNAQRLDVEAVADESNPNALVYVIRSDIVSAVQVMPVQFKTEVEVETGAATVRE
jgi:type VI secretion system protein ImpF